MEGTCALSRIPPFEANGHLPLGRYSASVAEVQARFVDDPMFAGSPTRLDCWRGLSTYLALWSQYQKQVVAALEGAPLVKCFWLAGSFISDRVDPNNIDLTLFVNGEALDRAKSAGLPVTRPLERLSNRSSALTRYRVSPIIIQYRYFRSPFPGNFDPTEAEYMRLRGGFDDFWSRLRQEGQDKQAPSRETGDWKRGYLEVIL